MIIDSVLEHIGNTPMVSSATLTLDYRYRSHLIALLCTRLPTGQSRQACEGTRPQVQPLWVLSLSSPSCSYADVIHCSSLSAPYRLCRTS